MSSPYPPQPQPNPYYNPPPPKKRRKGFALTCGIILGVLVLFLVMCGIIGSHSSQSDSANATDITDQATPTQAGSTSHIVFNATLQPTQAVKPLPTQAPEQAAPTQEPASVPTQAPASTGVNGNPWGYDFNASGGQLVTSPPSNFCDYFTCVSTFWKDTRGYVVECADGHYSHSGGVTGACSRNGGVKAALYAH